MDKDLMKWFGGVERKNEGGLGKRVYVEKVGERRGEGDYNKDLRMREG